MDQAEGSVQASPTYQGRIGAPVCRPRIKAQVTETVPSKYDVRTPVKTTNSLLEFFLYKGKEPLVPSFSLDRPNSFL